MKRFLLVLLVFAVCSACGGKKHSLKVTDPSERLSMRTRDAECPIDSLFTAKSLRTTFNVVETIKPGYLLKDCKVVLDTLSEDKPANKVREVYDSVRNNHSDAYNPGLTVYSAVVVLVFAVMMLVKIIRAIFKND